MKKFKEYYIETIEKSTVDHKTHNISGTPFYDFLSWAKKDKSFGRFVEQVKTNPSKKIWEMHANGPSGGLLLYWLPDKKDTERLEIDFENGRPLARSQRERIYHWIMTILND